MQGALRPVCQGRLTSDARAEVLPTNSTCSQEEGARGRAASDGRWSLGFREATNDMLTEASQLKSHLWYYKYECAHPTLGLTARLLPEESGMATEQAEPLKGGSLVTCHRAQAEVISVLIPTATCSRGNAMTICGGERDGVCCASASYLQLIRLGPVGPSAAPSQQPLQRSMWIQTWSSLWMGLEYRVS